MIDLSGKRALVTGGSRGIGAATARLLAACGADVMIGYRSRHADAERVVAELTAVGRRAAAHASDIGTREGARWLSVNPTDVSGARAQVRAEAGQVASVDPAAVTITITPAKSKYNAGDKVTIKASYSYLLLFGAITGNFSVPMSIQTTMTVLY